MDPLELGSQLRALRTAEGRTVASVAAVAGLSVPYIANLENGRGNPTVTALSRLAGALGTRLEISLSQDAAGQDDRTPATPRVPQSLVRLSRTARFRQAAAEMAAALGTGQDELTLRLVGALAALAQVLRSERLRPTGCACWMPCCSRRLTRPANRGPGSGRGLHVSRMENR